MANQDRSTGDARHRNLQRQECERRAERRLLHRRWCEWVAVGQENSAAGDTGARICAQRFGKEATVSSA